MRSASAFSLLLLLLLPSPGLAAVTATEVPIVRATSTGQSFTRDFAPAEGWVSPLEMPERKELCLNGRWSFQPVPLPANFQRDTGDPPGLPPPTPNGWDTTPIKIPSPWNVNTWGGQRKSGAGSEHPYDPGSLYYPSYPAAWDGIEMGWLRRSFRVPTDWGDRRIVLHFEAVAGECQVLINGQPAGSHFDKYLPFNLDITNLVHRNAENELLVGVRAHALFNKRSQRYPKMRAPYPTGSETERLVGIWQDVFLLGLPPVRVDDVFVKPLVDQDTLELEVTVRNDTEREQSVTIGGEVSPWVNLAGSDVLSAPEPHWKLGPVAMTLQAKRATIKPGQTVTLTLRGAAAGRLQFWTPDAPHLYTAVLSLTQEGQTLDRRSTRFGWRQFKIAGRDLLLNGKKIQLHADLLHPFGPFILSRRYVWAWYRMIKDMGGNAVRPHAQIHPRHYLDLADEMGIIVLDETAIFGSSVALNFEEPVAWQRFADHLDGLVLR
ncbi:MAG: beta-galactosidase, partial [Armatimonadota bacterium]|nr:beta-galactosidase [Armatimonadota bacterium]